MVIRQTQKEKQKIRAKSRAKYGKKAGFVFHHIPDKFGNISVDKFEWLTSKEHRLRHNRQGLKMLREFISKVVNNKFRGSTQSDWYDVIISVGREYGIDVRGLYEEF